MESGNYLFKCKKLKINFIIFFNIMIKLSLETITLCFRLFINVLFLNVDFSHNIDCFKAIPNTNDLI